MYVTKKMFFFHSLLFYCSIPFSHWNFFSCSQVAVEYDIAGIFYNLVALVLIMVWPYFYCFFADLVINRMANIQQNVCNLNWYDFPMEQQRSLILIIAQSQTSRCFNGLGLVYCNLVTFQTVIVCFIHLVLLFLIVRISERMKRKK